MSDQLPVCVGVADMLSDVSMEDSVAEVLASTNGHHDHRSHPVPQSVVEDQPVLLTPDAFFSSPGFASVCLLTYLLVLILITSNSK